MSLWIDRKRNLSIWVHVSSEIIAQKTCTYELTEGRNLGETVRERAER